MSALTPIADIAHPLFDHLIAADTGQCNSGERSKNLRAAQFSIAEIGVLFPRLFRLFLRFFPRH
jgi:hypothetical protein